jgi:tripartite-type tricarboxylate transporter receptor subunit TctC
MNRAKISYLISVLIGLVFLTSSGYPASDDFFRGKVVRIIVGTAAGGGYDTYSRVIARHMRKHIPGNPTIIVDNMVGAGSIIAANHLARIAKPDGLTIGHILGAVLFLQVLGRPGIEFDARKFEYIGVPVQDTYAIGLSKASGITTMEKWMASKTPVKIGATDPGGASYDVPKVLQAALGLPIQVVSGYKGTAAIKLAVESGEVAGFCTGWESFKSTWRQALDSGEGVIVVQVVPKPHPELPKVPLAINYAKNDEARKLIQVGGHDPAATARPYILPPGTPKDRVQILRKAFQQTMTDPEFLADADKSLLDINPLTGQELEKTVLELFKVDPAMIAKLNAILK